MTERLWQFWIDVGGTFTDCFALRPDGQLLRRKVLSSGITKGKIEAVADGGRTVVDPARRGEPPNFWNGYRLRLLDEGGQVTEENTVAEFNSRDGTLRLTASARHGPQSGQSYELTAAEEAPVLAIRLTMGLSIDEPIPSVSLKLGTTRGTNALITRRGAETAFVTTRGFGDILRIGYQNRPRLFELTVRKPPPLFCAVAEIDERITREGQVLTAPDPAQVRTALSALCEQHVQSLAICLLNGDCQPQHERLVAGIAREMGFSEISLSHEVAPLIKLVSRGDTTVVDAYLNPVLRSYVQLLRRSLDAQGSSDIRLLTSSGGLVSARRFVGKDSILSGPAGGVVGFSRAAGAAGFHRALGFDMGGTSTDVSRFDGRFELEYETEKAGVRVVAPMMAIETVAAGGGSICHFDGVKMAVGPDSAGADPGPACYGRGGPLSVTDVNLYLGKLLAAHFPFPLNHDAVQQRLDQLCDTIQSTTGRHYTPHELAEGFLRIANANMANAIRSISIAKGYDPADYVLVSFGGAAPQHACAVAEELGIVRILNHPDAGILSAYGIGLADVVRHHVEGVYRPYSEKAVADLEPVFERLTDQACREIVAEGVASDRIHTVRSLDLRYRGLDAFLTISCPNVGTYQSVYQAEHRRRYGYVHEDRPLEIVAAKVEAVGRSRTQLPESRPCAARSPEPRSTTRVYFEQQPHTASVYDRQALRPGDTIEGSAIVVESVSTTVVDPRWKAQVLSGGELLLSRKEQSDENESASDQSRGGRSPLPHGEVESDPVMLEIFNNQFATIAEQMGITLRNTSSSVNVKERLDFSCALFTPTGDLVVNAPHIPVHLGAMGETVKRIIADNPQMVPDDVYVTNDPYRGGSHLPDVTVVTPVHEPTTNQLLFFTASRAHHAELGGIAPGSMPPFSQNLAEEGVLLRNFKLVDAGQSRFDRLRHLLTSGPYPSRNVEDNLADLAAQVAANRQGVDDLLALIDTHTLPVVRAYMELIQEAAERKMRAALRRVPDGCHRFADYLDDGSPIAVSVTIDGDSAVLDFSGTGPVLSSNLNANRAIVTAAVMYCLRCLIDEDIPMNQGVLAPVEIVLSECLLNPPERPSPDQCAAVVGGNVETSQRVVDVLLGALKLAAASQGTMNNLLFGDETFGYYETICGGAGATPNAAGADAVHTHMTNTRLTDPEVLEQRYPVRVKEFSIRRGSGGDGLHRGGDGVVRSLEFLQKLEVSILSQRRGAYPPFGLSGGQPGAMGRGILKRADGRTETLSGRAKLTAQPGDTLTIMTPGGGGWGEAEADEVEELRSRRVVE
jgi:5-oxoprolinase (ATP-hydrolysing)